MVIDARRLPRTTTAAEDHDIVLSITNNTNIAAVLHSCIYVLYDFLVSVCGSERAVSCRVRHGPLSESLRFPPELITTSVRQMIYMYICITFDLYPVMKLMNYGRC